MTSSLTLGATEQLARANPSLTPGDNFIVCNMNSRHVATRVDTHVYQKDTILSDEDHSPKELMDKFGHDPRKFINSFTRAGGSVDCVLRHRSLMPKRILGGEKSSGTPSCDLHDSREQSTGGHLQLFTSPRKKKKRSFTFDHEIPAATFHHSSTTRKLGKCPDILITQGIHDLFQVDDASRMSG